MADQLPVDPVKDNLSIPVGDVKETGGTYESVDLDRLLPNDYEVRSLIAPVLAELRQSDDIDGTSYAPVVMNVVAGLAAHRRALIAEVRELRAKVDVLEIDNTMLRSEANPRDPVLAAKANAALADLRARAREIFHRPYQGESPPGVMHGVKVTSLRDGYEAELERLRADKAKLSDALMTEYQAGTELRRTLAAAESQNAALAASRDAVLALHQPVPHCGPGEKKRNRDECTKPPTCSVCWPEREVGTEEQPELMHLPTTWPCRTVRALTEGTEQ